MFPPSFMAFLHHVLAFTIVAVVAVQVVMFKPPLTAALARRIQITDRIYGLAALFMLIVGFLRVFYFEKGAAYYFHNSYFHLKLTLFIVLGLASVYPTMLFISWNRALKAGGVPDITPSQTKRARMCLMIELTAILGILFAASYMADGLGYFGD